jgi:ParB family transcriptional regulator, chromosome partitioning protein
MEIQLIPIEKIHPDPNQPRTIIKEEQIVGMAKSIKTEGVINPVEIDPNFMIITGEMRWRAAKLAGMSKVPCKVMEIDSELRFRRQVIENLHHNTMGPLDTARAIAKLLDLSPGEKSQGKNLGLSELSEKIGKGVPWISDTLALLREPEEVQEYLEAPDAHASFIREINRHAPEDLKPKLKRKVTAREINDRETINEVIRASKRNPEKTDEILSLDLSGKMPENMHKIHALSPPIVEAQEGKVIGDVVHNQLNNLANLYQKAMDMMEDVDMTGADLPSLVMIQHNGMDFRRAFEIFQGQVDFLVKKFHERELPQGE